MCLKPALVVKSSFRYSHAWWSQRLSNDVRWVWKSETRINKYIVITVSKPQTEILDRQQLPVIGSSKKSFVRNNSSKSPHFYRNWRIQCEHLMTDIVIFHSSYLDDCWYHPWTFCIVGIGLNCSKDCPSICVAQSTWQDSVYRYWCSPLSSPFRQSDKDWVMYLKKTSVLC